MARDTAIPIQHLNGCVEYVFAALRCEAATTQPDRVRKALSEFLTACDYILADSDKSLSDRFVLDDATVVESGEGAIATVRDRAVVDLHDILADRDWRLDREWCRLMRALK